MICQLSYAHQKIGFLGFPDFGDLWRGEMEMEDLKGKAFRLYEHVLPLYKLLHAYVRLKLGHFYGSLDVHQRTIPAHLLGKRLLILTE